MSNVTNRPAYLLDSFDRPIYDSVDALSFRGEYTGANLIYAAYARPGAAEGSLVWRISKQEYSGDNLVSIKYPQNTSGKASNDYEFSYTDRASYTYS